MSIKRQNLSQVFREPAQITELRRWFVRNTSQQFGIVTAIKAGRLFDQSLIMSYAGNKIGQPAICGINIDYLFDLFCAEFGTSCTSFFIALHGKWPKGLSNKLLNDAATGKLIPEQLDICHEAFNAMKTIHIQLGKKFTNGGTHLWAQDKQSLDVVINLALVYTLPFTSKEFAGHIQRIANISYDSAIVMLMSVDGLKYDQAVTFVDIVRLVNSKAI
ncbi:hypothetical protein TAC_0119 [Acinetobacter phage TAC1]|nr:hypothetical protein TAC_0119 [Acinetobacter phage TAC1]QMP19055.1 hypothetical protein FKOIJHOC_00107 [Acinetobacter phage Ab_121]UYL86240.1 hypothetical protein [Acinetobacter phage vB_AbaM_CP14]